MNQRVLSAGFTRSLPFRRLLRAAMALMTVELPVARATRLTSGETTGVPSSIAFTNQGSAWRTLS